MPRKERYARLTPVQLEAKWARQRKQRLTKPAYNGNLRGCFDKPSDYYELYDELYEKQEGKCAICGKHSSEFKHRLGMDHNHRTFEVRGLLCWSCNHKLGFVEKYLKQIVAYLRKYR